MNVRKTIGWNIKATRVAKNMAQDSLAHEAGIDRAYLGRIERGAENVTIARLEALATVLKVPVAKFFAVPKSKKEIPKLKAGRKPKK